MHFLYKKNYPDANKSVVGFHAQINTSDSCPLRTVALLAGISIAESISLDPSDPPAFATFKINQLLQ